MKSSLGLSWASLQKAMYATQPERSLQEILPETKLSSQKASFKNLHPICSLLCYQGPRSMSRMVILWGTSHTALSTKATARKPISKFFAPWEVSHTHWLKSKVSLNRQGHPGALTESVNHKMPFSFPLARWHREATDLSSQMDTQYRINKLAPLGMEGSHPREAHIPEPPSLLFPWPFFLRLELTDIISSGAPAATGRLTGWAGCFPLSNF